MDSEALKKYDSIFTGLLSSASFDLIDLFSNERGKFASQDKFYSWILAFPSFKEPDLEIPDKALRKELVSFSRSFSESLAESIGDDGDGDSQPSSSADAVSTMPREMGGTLEGKASFNNLYLKKDSMEDLPAAMKKILKAVLEREAVPKKDEEASATDDVFSGKDMMKIRSGVDELLSRGGKNSRVLQDMLSSVGGDIPSFYRLLTDPSFSPEDLPGVGDLKAGLIRKFTDDFRELVASAPLKGDLPPSIRDRDLSYVEGLYRQMRDENSSLRSAFDAVYDICHRDVAELYERVCSGNIIYEKIRGVGALKAGRLSSRLSGFVRDASTAPPSFTISGDVPAMTAKDEQAAEKAFEKLSFYDKGELYQMQGRLGYYPAVAAVSRYLDGLRERHRDILGRMTDIWDDATCASIGEMGVAYGVSSERIRQILVGIIDGIFSFLDGISRSWIDFSECPYDFLSDDLQEKVNQSEGTHFGRAFICAVLGFVYKDVKTVGNARAFMKVKRGRPSRDGSARGSASDAGNFIFLAPSLYYEIFDFDDFYRYCIGQRDLKKVKDEVVHLEKATSPFFRKDYSDDGRMWGTLEICRVLLRRIDGVRLEDGWNIVFPANARMNYPERLRDILSDVGKPLSAEQLSAIHNERYPDDRITAETARVNVRMTDDVVPVGRSGFFAMKQWGSGGTVADLAREYLKERGGRAPLSDVIAHIRKIRPSSTASSISGSLYADRSGTLILEKDKGRGSSKTVISLSNENTEVPKREISEFSRKSFSEKVEAVTRYVSDRGELPGLHSDDIETRGMANFIKNSGMAFKKGSMKEEMKEGYLSLMESIRSIVGEKDRMREMERESVREAQMRYEKGKSESRRKQGKVGTR